ncbi:MAG: MBL fold metallo-hydrolase [Clostridia bacterium]|nr:MBL fold metallo-hydrolase [Clostridia bacterium]
MSKNVRNALISFGVVILIILSCIIYYSDYYDDIANYFGINSSSRYNFVRFIDVGQGDCTLIHSDGKYVLIDAGAADNDGTRLAETLHELNVTEIECVIISHDDDDHTGGLRRILNEFDVEAVVSSKYSFIDDTKAINDIISAAKSSDTKMLVAEAGDRLFFGGAEFKFLWIDRETESNNERSLVTGLYLDGWTFFFGGDISETVEKRILESEVDVRCDVLKAAHHGSAYSTSEEFLDKAKPKYCVVSCSDTNSYGFPAEKFLSRISDRDIKLYATYRDGDIIFNTTKTEVYVKK